MRRWRGRRNDFWNWTVVWGLLRKKPRFFKCNGKRESTNLTGARSRGHRSSVRVRAPCYRPAKAAVPFSPRRAFTDRPLGGAADMSAALRVATVTPRALPHRAASGATAGPSRDPHPRWARLGPRRAATPLPESSPRRLSAERTRATARASTTDESSPSSGGEARQNTTDGVARIARREALARVEASLNRNDDWRNVLAVIEDASRASGVPPARCVRTTRLWGHAGARWDLPAVLAVLRALDGADFAACVRAVGEKGGARDALEVYKEGVKAGYRRDDGGASRAAMAWVHDGIGQGKQADALWVDLHAEARLGRVDVGKCARVAAGLNNWNRAKARGRPSAAGVIRRRRFRDHPRFKYRVHRGGGVRAGDRVEGAPAPARRRGCVRTPPRPPPTKTRIGIRRRRYSRRYPELVASIHASRARVHRRVQGGVGAQGFPICA